MAAAIFTFAFFSCKDDVLVPEPQFPDIPNFGDVYSLSFTVTVDNMGASETRGISTIDDPVQITKWENYINPERFRILFFDADDMFLFESKNRWVKQVDSNNVYSSWYVSVPLGAFGNDSYGVGKEYDWDKIRTHLTSKPFKIAVLANRPDRLLYPGFTESQLELPDGVFKNDGPNWGPEDTGKKSVFELHHCQYDIIYADKGAHKDGASASYYDFLMGDINTDRPTMGATINWVSFDNSKKKDLTSSVTMRYVELPSAEHPIPMYGIQRFDPIPKDLWLPGNPFDISNLPSEAFPDVPQGSYTYNTISLLRSCVRLDLKIPKTIKNGAKPSFVTLWYSNIYSRTEPVDTWTPTNEIWKDHDNGCEWLNIRNYGPVCNTSTATNKAQYQSRISWFYGAWKDKGWKYTTRTNTNVTVAGSLPYPRIFNTCIQRNKVIWAGNADFSDYYNDGYWHYVLYTGERNVNDANKLPDLSSTPYIACFVVSWDNSKYYCIPLLDYANNKDNDAANIFGPHTDGKVPAGNLPTALDNYAKTLISESGANLPYPLLRNHIYSFTLTGKTKADGDAEIIGVKSDVRRTRDIDFSEKVKMNRVSETPKYQFVK